MIHRDEIDTAAQALQVNPADVERDYVFGWLLSKIFGASPLGSRLVLKGGNALRNVTIDWTERQSVRAKIRVLVRRILRKHGYPPDKQERATQTVLEQAELLARDWAA